MAHATKTHAPVAENGKPVFFIERRQDLEPQYVENGSIYLFKPWVLEEHGNRLGGAVSLYVMDEHTVFEIDSMTDFTVIESLLTLRPDLGVPGGN